MSLSCLVEIKVLKAAEVQSGALIPINACEALEFCEL